MGLACTLRTLTVELCWIEDDGIHNASSAVLNYHSELNNRSTPGAVVSRLPAPLQFKWFIRLSNLLRINRVPTFADLTRVVQDRAEAAAVKSM